MNLYQTTWPLKLFCLATIHLFFKQVPILVQALRLEAVQQTQPSADRLGRTPSSVLLPLWPWACSSPEPPFPQEQHGSKHNPPKRWAWKLATLTYVHSAAAQAGSRGLSARAGTWALPPSTWATSSLHDISLSLNREDSALQLLYSVSQTTPPSDGR